MGCEISQPSVCRKSEICLRSRLLKYVFCHGSPGAKNTYISASVRFSGFAAKPCAQLRCFGGKAPLGDFSTGSKGLCFLSSFGIFWKYHRTPSCSRSIFTPMRIRITPPVISAPVLYFVPNMPPIFTPPQEITKVVAPIISTEQTVLSS